jgi:hypothetical protein
VAERADAEEEQDGVEEGAGDRRHGVECHGSHRTRTP